MYAQGKMPESIKTTETHRRVYDVTLSEPEAHKALIWAAMNKAGLTPTMSNPQSQTGSVSTSVSVYESDTDYDGHSEIIYSVVITEDLLKPAITDFAPPNIEEIVRLNPPATPGLSHGQLAQALEEGRRMLDGVKRPSDAIERMKRITRLHEVLLHGKGHNIVLNRDEVDTLLEILEHSADA